MPFWIVLCWFSIGMDDCDVFSGVEAPGGNRGIGTAVCPLAGVGATWGRLTGV